MQEHPMGSLSEGTTKYLKKEIKSSFPLSSQIKAKNIQISIQISLRMGEATPWCKQQHIQDLQLMLALMRIRKLRNLKNLSRITVKSHKQINTAFFAITLSIFLMPLLYIFNIGLKSYQYINIYITCCLCYSGVLRFILFFTLPAYAILIVMAIVFAALELIRQVPLLISKNQNVHQILFGK